MGTQYSNIELPTIFLPNLSSDDKHILHEALQLFVVPHEIDRGAVFGANRLQYTSLYESTINYYVSNRERSLLSVIALANGLQLISSNINLYRAYESYRGDMNATPFYKIRDVDSLSDSLSKWYTLAQQAIKDGDTYVSCGLFMNVHKSVYDTPFAYSTVGHANMLLMTLLPGNHMVVSRHYGHGNVIPYFAKILDGLAEKVAVQLC